MVEGSSLHIDYLRISVTDRCNLRCIYCMPPEGVETVNHGSILTFEEIFRLTKIFASLGIKKVRFTGGEPLVRKDMAGLIEKITNIKAIENISLTTNGVLLAQNIQPFKSAGLKSINVSIDTLRQKRFRSITGFDCLSSVLDGIKNAKQSGIPLKLNTVVMKGINDDEINDFVNFAIDNGLILRFIEFMKVTPLWNENLFMPIEQIKKICDKKFNIAKAAYRSSGPAQYYQINGSLLGFIKTSIDNCRICSRLRLTSTGELKLCLYQPYGICLRDLLRKNAGDDHIAEVIKGLICIKDDVDYRRWVTAVPKTKIYMCSVGG